MPFPDIAILLARQRSGTNPLRQGLGAHPHIFATPEVFPAEPSSRSESEWAVNFFRFLEQHPKGTIRRALSLETQEEIFVDFLESVRNFSDKRVVLMDAKPNSTHHLGAPWRSPRDPSACFNCVTKHRRRTLHLTRRNYL